MKARRLLWAIVLELPWSFSCASDGAPPSGSAGAGGEKPTSEAPISCVFGNDEQKCDGSSSQACVPSLSEPLGPCVRDKDCAAGSLCFEDDAEDQEERSQTKGVCRALSGTCGPLCSSDHHCGDSGFDPYCNPRVGTCQRERAQGKGFGELCDPDRTECRGLCVAIGDQGECEERCRIGASNGCGVEDYGEASVACSFFAYNLSDFDVTQGAGDVGVCAHLCNCDHDCPGRQRCLPRGIRDYRGICAGGLEADEGIDCSMGGAGSER